MSTGSKGCSQNLTRRHRILKTLLVISGGKIDLEQPLPGGGHGVYPPCREAAKEKVVREPVPSSGSDYGYFVADLTSWGKLRG